MLGLVTPQIGDDAAAEHHDDAVGERHDLIQLGRDDEDRSPLVTGFDDLGMDVLDRTDVDAPCGL